MKVETVVTVKLEMSGPEAADLREAIKWVVGLPTPNINQKIQETGHGQTLIHLHDKLAGTE